MKLSIGLLKANLRRVFGNHRIYISVLLLACSLFLSVGDRQAFCISVINIFEHAVTSIVFMSTFMICAYPYANVFTEDLENGFMRYMVIRGGAKQYLWSSVLMIMLSSIIVMACGCLLFGAILSIYFPWTDEISLSEMMVGCRWLFQEDTMWLWMVVWGVRMGIQAAVLSIASAMFSLFLTNKLMVFIMPALLYELVQEINVELYERGIFLYNRSWFQLNYQPTGDAISTGISLLLFAGLCIGLMVSVMEVWIKRRI